MTAAIQNIEALIRYGKRPKKCAVIAIEIKNIAKKDFAKLQGTVRTAIEISFPVTLHRIREDFGLT